MECGFTQLLHENARPAAGEAPSDASLPTPREPWTPVVIKGGLVALLLALALPACGGGAPTEAPTWDPLGGITASRDLAPGVTVELHVDAALAPIGERYVGLPQPRARVDIVLDGVAACETSGVVDLTRDAVSWFAHVDALCPSENALFPGLEYEGDFSGSTVRP